MNTQEINYGRVINHDPRSLAFKVPLDVEIKTINWEHKAPVLHQGTSNACTGMAFTQMVNMECNTELRKKISGKTDYLDDQFAYQVYSKATEIDEFPGQMPTEDTGSSALAVCKVAHRAEWISKYQTAIGWEECQKAIQTSPVMIGVLWTNMMNQPRDDGFIEPLGNELGGHEVLMTGLDVENQYVTLLSSYGESYGHRGQVKMKVDQFSWLLHQLGDAMTVSL